MHKFLINLYGYSLNLENYQTIEADISLRKTFANDIVDKLNQWEYDSGEIDCECYPEETSDYTTCRTNITDLIHEVHSTVKQNDPNYIVMFC